MATVPGRGAGGRVRVLDGLVYPMPGCEVPGAGLRQSRAGYKRGGAEPWSRGLRRGLAVNARDVRRNLFLPGAFLVAVGAQFFAAFMFIDLGLAAFFQ
jgi:hypothetical protein